MKILIVDARLENGSRVNAVIYPVALDGPILTIRRFPEYAITMEDLIAKESITRGGNISGTDGKSRVFDPDRRRDFLR